MRIPEGGKVRWDKNDVLGGLCSSLENVAIYGIGGPSPWGPESATDIDLI